MANINDVNIQCMQRQINGEVVITFKSPAVKEKSDFLLLRQKDLFGELFSEIYVQGSSEFTFL